MTETMMGRRDDVTAVRGDERVRCGVSWWRLDDSRTPYRVRADGPWGSASATGDLFGSLMEVRLQLEAHGWRLLVNGARPDVWQSGRLRSSGSTRGYRLHPGAGAAPDDTVELFEEADAASVVPVAEHRAAYAAWKASVTAAKNRLMVPEPTLGEALRARAKRAPGSWLYSIDPAYDPRGTVPPYAVVGAWPVDRRGEPGEFSHNPDYRPSPTALGLPAPTDPVDAAMQLAATGHGAEAALARRLAEATVYLVPTDEPGPAVRSDAEGRFVPVLTDPEHAPSAAAELRAVPCAELLATLPADVALKLNPGSRVSVRVPSAELRAALG
ncbi:type VII secretion system-associated protein [Streptomyces sp. NPDC001828]|uniref:type VII secretion system-associated protein n=1 Tax=Streptomyces sp. NPDC001828 TaxID=3364615 RepID=UPI00367C9AC8